MTLPDGSTLILDPGHFVEPTLVEGRLIFWLSGELQGGYRQWERVASVPHASLTVEAGLVFVPSTSVSAQQWVGGPLQKLWRRRGRAEPERTWSLPDGGTVEQVGSRRVNLILAWSSDKSTPVTVDRIRTHWPNSSNLRSIGPNLFVVAGIEAVQAPASSAEEPAAMLADSPRGRAEQTLLKAREVGDPSQLALALADLGLACLQGGDLRRGSEWIEEALREARRSGDKDLETNIMIDQGVAALSSNQPARAREVLEPALALARTTGRRFSEKAALDRLGQAFMVQGEYTNALEHFERSLSLAVELEDSSHQADLLWRIGLQHAELGRRDRAITLARAAVDRMKRLGRPQAAWYAHHLEQYRNGEVGLPDASPVSVSSQITTSLPEVAQGPGALRMALSALGSMGKFIGSGFQTTTPEVYQERLQACAPCDHHTGLRCRLCGCFTATKAHLLYERCPIGKWSA